MAPKTTSKLRLHTIAESQRYENNVLVEMLPCHNAVYLYGHGPLAVLDRAADVEHAMTATRAVVWLSPLVVRPVEGQIHRRTVSYLRRC